MKMGRPRRRPEFEKVSPTRRGKKMDFFEELQKGLSPTNDNGRIAGRIETIEALREMMLGEPIKARATWGAGHNITHLWDVKQSGNILGLEDGKGEEVYIIVVRKEQDDIPSTDVQVCPEAKEEAGQGV